MARPTPVLPEVGSTIVPPGFSFPSRSAASIIGRPMRSFTEPPGFRYSSFARICAPPRGESFSSRTIGVAPTSSSTVGNSLGTPEAYSFGRSHRTHRLLTPLFHPRRRLSLGLPVPTPSKVEPDARFGTPPQPRASRMSALAAAIASRAPSFGRGGLRWLNLGLLLIAAGVGVLAYVAVGSKPAATTTAIQQTSTVTRGVVLSSVSATGSIVAAKNLSLNFQSSGTLTAVEVKAGQHVAKGQLLGKVDSTAAAASLRQAQASLSSARANLQAALAGETATQRKQDALSVATAKAALANAQATTKTDAMTANAAVAQAAQQQRADQGNEAVAVAQKKTDLGSYTDLAAVQAAATAAQATVSADQTTQHTHQQTQFDLQTQQTVANQQLATDKGNASAESSDQATLNSIALQLQAIAKTLANDSYQLSQDQAVLSTIQSTVNAVKADLNSIQSYEAKLVSDTNSINSAKTN